MERFEMTHDNLLERRQVRCSPRYQGEYGKDMNFRQQPSGSSQLSAERYYWGPHVQTGHIKIELKLSEVSAIECGSLVYLKRCSALRNSYSDMSTPELKISLARMVP